MMMSEIPVPKPLLEVSGLKVAYGAVEALKGIDLTVGKGRGGEIGCDLREGKPSIFFAYTFDRGMGTQEERDRLRQIVAKPRDQTTAADVDWAIGFYRATGALQFAEEEARALIARAEATLDNLPLPAGRKETFRSISRFMIERNS